MVKKIVICFCLIISLINIDSFAISSTGNTNSYTEAITVLESLDIIRKPETKWNESSFISRRDILEMIYIVKSYSREFVVNPSYRSAEELQEVKQEGLLHEHKEYSDVELGSYDDFLVTSAECYGLFNGVNSSSGYLANLDNYATYGEALTFVGYLFYDTTYGLTIDEYYNIAKDMNIINPIGNLDQLSLKINEDDLKQSISAYDFLILLYRSLYVPNGEISDWGSDLDSFYVNRFFKKYEQNTEIENIV